MKYRSDLIRSSALAIALLCGAALVAGSFTIASVSDAQAQQGSGQGGGGHGGGGQGGGGQGGGGQGGGGGGHDGGSSGGSGGSQGANKGGGHSTSAEPTDSDGRGPQYGKPDGSRGKPVWAAEGIPEVELGRLNVIRAPGNILDSARAELVKTFDADGITYYNMTAEALADLLRSDWDNVTAVMIDSPLENLAVFRDAVNGVSVLPGVTVDIDLMAITLGMASDKNVPISDNTVIAVITILGGDPADFNVSALADKAEDIRAAALAGHG
mgnify:CR=1 FL=1